MDLKKLIERGRKWVLSHYPELAPELTHHGVKGQKWGVRNGPPYPLDRSKSSKLKNASGQNIIVASRTSLTGLPNSISQVTHKKRRY